MKRTLLILALIALIALGCEKTENYDITGPTPPGGGLFARFSGTFTPVAAATPSDPVCRLRLAESSSGGSPPYACSWDAAALAGDSASTGGYPDSCIVDFVFDPAYGAGATAPRTIRLVVTDADGTRDDSSSSRIFDCTIQAGFTFTGS